MRADAPGLSARQSALLGLVGLGSAMGIGRFAFTPLLPLMQDRFGLSIAQGATLASINYVGYLVGALLCVAFDPPPGRAARVGLATVALSTLAMALTPWFWLWALWRLLAGVASAYVLVGVSGWVMNTLALQGRAAWSGWVFTGVGLGIGLAGLVGLLAGASGAGPTLGWLALGGVASAVVLLSWRHYVDVAADPHHGPVLVKPPSRAESWRLVLCYGAFGYGYIIPATFLPSQMRELVSDPAVFGWAWPVFGLAAALSAALAAGTLAWVPPRRMWAACQALLAVGVALPALHLSLLTLTLSALVVGGTFVVLTQAALQEARRVGGASATRLMAAMTAAFAVGQLIGPLTISSAASGSDALRLPSLVGAALLGLGALALLVAPPERTT